jgi:hypothetical protein
VRVRGARAAVAGLVLAGLTGCTVGTLTVQNDSSSAIWYVRFSPTWDTQWGEDRLGEAETIQPGGARSWTVPSDTYNVEVEFSDHRKLDAPEVYEVTSGGEVTCRVHDVAAPSPSPAPAATPAPPPAPATGTLTVSNETQQPLYRVRFKPTTDAAWGEDRLGGSETIEPGTSRSWTVPAGTYHVKVEFGDGTALGSLEEYAVPADGGITCRVRPTP